MGRSQFDAVIARRFGAGKVIPKTLTSESRAKGTLCF
jgi:hypothetical protein